MSEAATYIRDSLKDIYPPGEINSFIRLIMEQVCGLRLPQLLMGKDKDLSDARRQQIREIVRRLKQSEPIQYILGQTSFYDLDFLVTPAVLIPRPETEEMADLIIKENKGKKLRVLDIGTGSGCIAVTLARHLPGAEVVAIDISAEALAVARRNAVRNRAKVTFIQTDILDEARWEDIPGRFDIIASNPPYVMESERAAMQENVLRYEPSPALFVTNADPLQFYKAIASFARQKLNKGGRIYTEINAQCGPETLILFQSSNYEGKLIKDISGKDRIIRANTPS